GEVCDQLLNLCFNLRTERRLDGVTNFAGDVEDLFQTSGLAAYEFPELPAHLQPDASRLQLSLGDRADLLGPGVTDAQHAHGGRIASPRRVEQRRDVLRDVLVRSIGAAL